MTEFEDILVGGEFAAFREAYAPAVRPAGTDAVRETVRRRRRRTAVAAATAVVLAVVIPVGANAALVRRSDPPPAPAQTGEPTPTETPSPAPTPSVASSSPTPPDGRISRSDLLAARVDLPSWPSYVPETCTTSGVTLRPGPIGEYRPVLLGDPEYGDLDGDGAADTVALLGCRIGEAQVKQVVAFDRDTDGRITTMGQIVGTHDELGDITDLTIEDAGAVRVRVADRQPCCGESPDQVRTQWRTYAWAGGRFRQTAGPVTFPSNAPTSPGPATSKPVTITFTITATELVYGPPDADGMRRGTNTVTIVNTGNGTAEYPLIIFPRNGRDDPVHGEWGKECPRAEGTSKGVACVSTPLRAGERRTITFPFLTTSSGPPGEATVQVAAGTGLGVTLLPGTTPTTATFSVSFS
ncbi:hypothetical protein [Micromonospora sp. NPDC007230]|uniref:hypothetical protein n=1 Tax=Micromonospora sp. NPDC007230 TaxID=3364237 RepID=UPI0036AB21E8